MSTGKDVRSVSGAFTLRFREEKPFSLSEAAFWIDALFILIERSHMQRFKD